MKALWSEETSRKIIERVVIEGELVLITPAHFGNGDSDQLTDMILLVDSLDEKRPLLTGASLAGSLRNYLREIQHGFRSKETNTSFSTQLFGITKEGLDQELSDGEQSPLIIGDSLGENFGIELRNGVRINAKSRTAEDQALYNLELWQAGTKFLLRFELVVCQDNSPYKLKQALATALKGLSNGSITLGARKNRGYGKVMLTQWYIRSYNLTALDDLLDWIENGEKPLLERLSLDKKIKTVTDIQVAFPQAREPIKIPNQHHYFLIKINLAIDGSLLIRSSVGGIAPDFVHIQTKQVNSLKDKPILPGTSLAGVIRARATKIANTLGKNQVPSLVDDMFGIADNMGEPKASRVMVTENMIQDCESELVQNRVSIDRFTGGALETALFNEQPVFGMEQTLIEQVEIKLINPKEYEIGLLLLILKDLWTGDLTIGGESSIGRGRLKGKNATLVHFIDGKQKGEWKIKPNGLKLDITGKKETLEDFVQKFINYNNAG
ncbi:MAG: hypothetical protein HY819_11285 [Acidobacteria bacterium]|nr:hypothetical protein [Acidobacteriota bacterium]